ncbi:unannotated protein [freshwater metagenome]|uniref:Unannotated protein n=1 Tax=freshwater metagenome TaxID=449393 RepID=A0A6J7CX50_9ZZZZ
MPGDFLMLPRFVVSVRTFGRTIPVAIPDEIATRFSCRHHVRRRAGVSPRLYS